MEAEIVATSKAVKEVIWLSQLLQEMTIIQIDNAAAVRLEENKAYSEKTLFIREHVLEGRLFVEQVATEYEIADVLTKPSAYATLADFRSKMGLIQFFHYEI